ncbi:MAG: methylated-DNA--[protein]-cysteine S-methyltransferase [Dehalococcoidia bacterium]
MTRTSTGTVFEKLTVDSPIGPLSVAVRDGVLYALELNGRGSLMEARLRRRFGAVELTPGPARHPAAQALRAYFAGKVDALDGLEAEPGGTAFQRSVWDAMRAIPPGETRTYRDLAVIAGNGRAVRAVGQASGANPVGIVIPCHRVVGSDGTLTGYGGGLERKRWLLRHEGALASG